MNPLPFANNQSLFCHMHDILHPEGKWKLKKKKVIVKDTKENENCVLLRFVRKMGFYSKEEPFQKSNLANK